MEERGAISIFDLTSEIHGHHVYKEIWTAIVGEKRNCECEFGNLHDPYAVAIMKDSQVVGHVFHTPFRIFGHA